MGIQIESSNSLQDLSQVLSMHIKENNPGVFRPVYIVTQTGGMNAWLKQRIAEDLGIAANLRFLSPNELIFKVYYLLGGKYRKSLDAGQLIWVIYQILGEESFRSRFPRIAAYYAQNAGEVKKMSLAEKIADLFDQYQIYRPQMIIEWNEGKKSGRLPDEDWQMWIWQRAREKVGDLMPDKSVVAHSISTRLQNVDAAEKVLEHMPAIYLFGISLITRYHYQLLELISGKIPVHFLILNPAPGIYWYEDLSEKAMAYLKSRHVLPIAEQSDSNPLLTHWGKVIQNTFRLLFESESAVNAYEVVSEKEIKADSFLHKVQKAISENTPAIAGGVHRSDLRDETLTIHSCHNPFREVQVLYNYLVQLIDLKKEKLSPRDIVVVVSDIELYAPYIRAVFNHAPYRFKFKIADEPYTATDSVFNAMVSILELNPARFTAENVFRLSDFSCIRHRFGFGDTELIRRVIDTANIRFGIDGDLEDDTRYISWRYGLKRIMWGICMGGGEEFGEGPESFYPLDLLEGEDAREAVRFVHFVTTLISFLESRKTSRTVLEWSLHLEDIYNTFLFNPGSAGENESLLLEKIHHLNSVDDFFREKLSYDVFIRQFLPVLTHSTRSELFAGGGITFCSPIPMRSIPFKVVAMLGMDFDKLPRKHLPVSFDLMEQDKQRGDRNIKENDKHLFLETLLSAQKYFFISYCGQSIKDNSELPPSILVDELVNYIKKYADDSSEVDHLPVTRHPLHDFSPRYNREERLISYTNVLCTDKPGFGELSGPFSPRAYPEEQEQTASTILFKNFSGFFRDPFKYFYNHALGIYLHQEEMTLAEKEVFELDSLNMHSLKQDLLKMEESELPGYLNMKVKTGGFPLKNMGQVLAENAAREIAGVRSLWKELTRGLSPEKVDFRLLSGEHVLEGRLEKYGDNLIEVCFSKSETKYLFTAYLKHLITSALGLGLSTFFVSCQKGEYFQAATMDKKEAQERLRELVDFFLAGQERILPFSFDALKSEKTWGKLTKEMLEGILENRHSYPSEYLMREYEKGYFGTEDVFEEFNDISVRLLLPLKTFLPEYFT